MCFTSLLKSQVHLSFHHLLERKYKNKITCYCKSRPQLAEYQQKRWSSRKKSVQWSCRRLGNEVQGKHTRPRGETHSTSKKGAAVMDGSLLCGLGQRWSANSRIHYSMEAISLRTRKLQEIYASMFETREKNSNFKELSPQNLKYQNMPHPCCWWSQKCPHKTNFWNECFQQILLLRGIKDYLLLIRFPACKQDGLKPRRNNSNAG